MPWITVSVVNFTNPGAWTSFSTSGTGMLSGAATVSSTPFSTASASTAIPFPASCENVSCCRSANSLHCSRAYNQKAQKVCQLWEIWKCTRDDLLNCFGLVYWIEHIDGTSPIPKCHDISIHFHQTLLVSKNIPKQSQKTCSDSVHTRLQVGTDLNLFFFHFVHGGAFRLCFLSLVNLFWELCCSVLCKCVLMCCVLPEQTQNWLLHILPEHTLQCFKASASESVRLNQKAQKVRQSRGKSGRLQGDWFSLDLFVLFLESKLDDSSAHQLFSTCPSKTDSG